MPTLLTDGAHVWVYPIKKWLIVRITLLFLLSGAFYIIAIVPPIKHIPRIASICIFSLSGILLATALTGLRSLCSPKKHGIPQLIVDERGITGMSKTIPGRVDVVIPWNEIEDVSVLTYHHPGDFGKRVILGITSADKLASLSHMGPIARDEARTREKIGMPPIAIDITSLRVNEYDLLSSIKALLPIYRHKAHIEHPAEDPNI